MVRALVAIVVLLGAPASAWGQQFDRQTLLRVLLATDAKQVADCLRVGLVRDSSPEDLRKKILRSGGDTGLVTFDTADPDKLNAEVYRCQKPAPAAAAAAPAANVPSDPTGVQNVLLGTWAGTLSAPTIPVSYARPGSAPATLRMTDEGGQLRWTLQVAGQDLSASGTVTHFFGEISLNGTYSQSALPITYSLKLNGQTLEGSGVGPDRIVRTLSLRKQP